MTYFINLSNHPMTKWSEKQRSAAEYMCGEDGLLVDFSFPQINPEATEDDIIKQASDLLDNIMNTHPDVDIIFHIAGEMTFVVYFVSLCERKYKDRAVCLTSTTKRNTVDNPDGTKTVRFDFVQFRLYITA